MDEPGPLTQLARYQPVTEEGDEPGPVTQLASYQPVTDEGIERSAQERARRHLCVGARRRGRVVGACCFLFAAREGSRHSSEWPLEAYT